MTKNTRHSSDTQANKLIDFARKTVLGDGVKKAIEKAKAMPKKYPGNTGILFLPEWQDAVLEPSARPKKVLLSMKRDETKMEAGAGSPKYPHIKVQFTEKGRKDRSPFAIIGEVNYALRLAGVPQEERDKFFAEAIASTYPGVLQTAVKWVSVFDVSGLDESNPSSERHAVP